MLTTTNTKRSTKNEFVDNIQQGQIDFLSWYRLNPSPNHRFESKPLSSKSEIAHLQMAEDAGESLSQDSQSSSWKWAENPRDPHLCHDRERRSEREKSTEKDERPEKEHLNGLKMPDPSRDRSRDGATRDSQSAMQQPFQRRFPKYGFKPKTV